MTDMFALSIYCIMLAIERLKVSTVLLNLNVIKHLKLETLIFIYRNPYYYNLFKHFLAATDQH